MKRRSRSQSTEEAAVSIKDGGGGIPPIVLEIPESKEKAAGSEAARLRQEIIALRATLANKAAELRALGGNGPDGQSDTVRKLVELLKREEGATKAQLVEVTGAKKAYVEALLNRILPSKGYLISSAVLEGAKVKTYRIS